MTRGSVRVGWRSPRSRENTKCLILLHSSWHLDRQGAVVFFGFGEAAVRWSQESWIVLDPSEMRSEVWAHVLSGKCVALQGPATARLGWTSSRSGKFMANCLHCKACHIKVGRSSRSPIFQG